MASSALEAKINKIRQQNEEIRRRYEEVEEDKKNAAKLNALVQMVPSTDWPERKEPPEFSNPPRPKQKIAKEKQDQPPPVHPVEGKKIHTFAQGEGPPPDPKYNFLADSEREEVGVEQPRESSGNRQYNKAQRGNFRKKGPGREYVQKQDSAYVQGKGNQKDEYQPGYEAWRAERNRIDEDRISRQRTAEGNWRREWDNDKMHIVDDVTKNTTRSSLGDFLKKDYDRKCNVNGSSDHANQSRGGGGYRPYRGGPKNFHNNYDSRPYNTYEHHKHNPMKAPLSPNVAEERTVVATDKGIKVTLNQGNAAKGQVMSVKVNSPSIAGTGRVGPRQRTRVTYSHADAEIPAAEVEGFPRQKSFEEKSKAAYFNNQKFPNVRRAHSLKKPGSKSPYLGKKEMKGGENNASGQRHNDHEFGSYLQREHSQKSYFGPKSPRVAKGTVKSKQGGAASPTKQLENEESTEIRETEVIKAESSKIEDSEDTENSKRAPEQEATVRRERSNNENECEQRERTVELVATTAVEICAPESNSGVNEVVGFPDSPNAPPAGREELKDKGGKEEVENVAADVVENIETLAKDSANGKNASEAESSCPNGSADQGSMENREPSSDENVEETRSSPTESNTVVEGTLGNPVLSNTEEKVDSGSSANNCDNVEAEATGSEKQSDQCSVIEEGTTDRQSTEEVTESGGITPEQGATSGPVEDAGEGAVAEGEPEVVSQCNQRSVVDEETKGGPKEEDNCDARVESQTEEVKAKDGEKGDSAESKE